MRLTQVLIAIDQVFNTIFGGLADETLSARCFRLGVFSTTPSKFHAYMVSTIDRLFFWQHDHCMNAFIAEVARKQLPSIYQTEAAIKEYAILARHLP